MAWIPSVGTDVNSDFDPSKHQYCVPILRKDILLQRGGAYISEFVPPSIKLKDGTEFVLTTHRVSDLYRTQPSGKAYVPAGPQGTPKLPGPGAPNAQEQTLPLISEAVMARHGKMSMTPSLPKFVLSPDPAQPPIVFYAISPTIQRSERMVVEAHFTVPNSSSSGPYPLRMAPKFKQNERFAIPPNPTASAGELEYATGTAEAISVVSILETYWYVFVVLFALIVAIMIHVHDARTRVS